MSKRAEQTERTTSKSSDHHNQPSAHVLHEANSSARPPERPQHQPAHYPKASVDKDGISFGPASGHSLSHANARNDAAKWTKSDAATAKENGATAKTESGSGKNDYYTVNDLHRVSDKMNNETNLGALVYALNKEKEFSKVKGGRENLSDADYNQIAEMTDRRNLGPKEPAKIPEKLAKEINSSELVGKDGQSPSAKQRENMSYMAEDIVDGNMKRLGHDTDSIGWRNMNSTYAPGLQQAFDKAGYNIGLNASSQEATKGDLYVYPKHGAGQTTNGAAITETGPRPASFENKDGKIIGPGGEVLNPQTPSNNSDWSRNMWKSLGQQPVAADGVASDGTSR